MASKSSNPVTKIRKFWTPGNKIELLSRHLKARQRVADLSDERVLSKSVVFQK